MRWWLARAFLAPGPRSSCAVLGRTVALLDAYGAGNSRSSSGGESRILRMGYGADEIYTRWAMRSRELWTAVVRANRAAGTCSKIPACCGPLRPAIRARPACRRHSRNCGVAFQSLDVLPDLARILPADCDFAKNASVCSRPEAGVILARRAVQAVVEEAVREGVEYALDAALPTGGSQVKTESGKVLSAGSLVYCLRALAAEDFPGSFRRPHSSHTPGSVFLWNAGGRPELRSAPHAGLDRHYR